MSICERTPYGMISSEHDEGACVQLLGSIRAAWHSCVHVCVRESNVCGSKRGLSHRQFCVQSK